MQYCIFIYRLLDTIGRKYEHVGYAYVGISVAVYWCCIHKVLSNIYIYTQKVPSIDMVGVYCPDSFGKVYQDAGRVLLSFR